MTRRNAARLAWFLWALCAALSIAAAILAYRIEAAGFTSDRAFRFDGVVGIVFPFVGALIASRRPDNRIAWLMTAIGASAAAGAFFPEYAQFADQVAELPGADLAVWIGGWVWVPSFALVLTFLLLLFPTGHLSSRSWRWFARFAGTGIALGALSLAFLPSGSGENEFGANPYGIEAQGSVLTVSGIVAGAIHPSQVSLWLRSPGSSS